MVEPLLAALFSAALEGALPVEMAGWKADGPAAHYDAETIFDYIDGHGEIYLAYGMRSCTARRFEGPPAEGGVLLDVFEMGSAADAFGIFTHARDGEVAGIGEESSFGAGTLAFWKGSTFVSITAERSTGRSRAAVLALGRAAAAGIARSGSRPKLVDRRPAAGLEKRSVVYLRHPIILSAHLDLAGNVLGVSPETPAALGRYRRAGDTGWLLLVQHSSEKEAEAARKAFSAAFLEKAGVTGRADGWWAVSPLRGAEGPATAVVVRASSRELAERLLQDARRSEAPARTRSGGDR